MTIDRLYGSLPIPFRMIIKKILMALLKPKLKKFYASHIKPGSLVYDVGAHQGDYTKIFLGLGARILAIEPNPHYVTILKQQFTDNDDVVVLACGVGAKSGQLDFHISSFNSPNSSFSSEFREKSRYSHRSWDKVIKVEMQTLDQLIKKYGLPDFCKIDVEGYEWEVLSSLKKPIPLISFEFLSELNEKTFQIIRHVDTLGKARYNLCLGMQYRYKLKQWISGNELIALLQTEEANQWNGDIYVKYDL